MADKYQVGHRERLRERFEQGGVDALQEYEILEMFLFNSLPRRDVKPIAKELLNHFGNLYEVLHANDYELTKVKGVGSKVVFDLKVLKAMNIASDKSLAKAEKVDVNKYPSLIKYLKTALAHKTAEEMWVATYDSKGFLIKIQKLFQGTVNASVADKREILKHIINQRAIGVILCHNHPSGDPHPSIQDINFTMSFQQALMTIDQNINLMDHIVIGKDGYYSFYENGKL